MTSSVRAIEHAISLKRSWRGATPTRTPTVSEAAAPPDGTAVRPRPPAGTGDDRAADPRHHRNRGRGRGGSRGRRRPRRRSHGRRLRGRVVEWLEGDAAWQIVDRISTKYTGGPYPRDEERVVALIEPDRQIMG
jgi:hypothetical protein